MKVKVYNHETRESSEVEVSPEDESLAREYIVKGWTSTSSKYRTITLFDTSARQWKELESATLTPVQFACFKHLDKNETLGHGAAVYRQRQDRRAAAVRLLHALDDCEGEERVEMMIDIMTDCDAWSAYLMRKKIYPIKPGTCSALVKLEKGWRTCPLPYGHEGDHK